MAADADTWLTMVFIGAGTPDGEAFFARLNLTEETTSGWETGYVPLSASASAGDRPVITADLNSDRLYVHRRVGFSSPQGGTSSVELTVSESSGDDFVSDPPTASYTGVRLAYRFTPTFPTDAAPGGTWAIASAVEPDGDVHFIWNQSAGASPAQTLGEEQLDQIRYRPGRRRGSGRLCGH